MGELNQSQETAFHLSHTTLLLGNTWVTAQTKGARTKNSKEVGIQSLAGELTMMKWNRLENHVEISC